MMATYYPQSGQEESDLIHRGEPTRDELTAQLAAAKARIVELEERLGAPADAAPTEREQLVARLTSWLASGGFFNPGPMATANDDATRELILDVRAFLDAAPDGFTHEMADLGLSIDMLDVDRLREWARLLLVHGGDIGHWGSVPFVAGKMQMLATGIEQAIRDIGTLRHARQVALDRHAGTQSVRDVLQRMKSFATTKPSPQQTRQKSAREMVELFASELEERLGAPADAAGTPREPK